LDEISPPEGWSISRFFPPPSFIPSPPFWSPNYRLSQISVDDSFDYTGTVPWFSYLVVSFSPLPLSFSLFCPVKDRRTPYYGTPFSFSVCFCPPAVIVTFPYSSLQSVSLYLSPSPNRVLFFSPFFLTLFQPTPNSIPPRPVFSRPSPVLVKGALIRHAPDLMLVSPAPPCLPCSRSGFFPNEWTIRFWRLCTRGFPTLVCPDAPP